MTAYASCILPMSMTRKSDFHITSAKLIATDYEFFEDFQSGNVIKPVVIRMYWVHIISGYYAAFTQRVNYTTLANDGNISDT